MSAAKAILEAIKTQLAAVNANRIVSRTFKNFGSRPDSDFQQGVYSVISSGRPSRQNGLDYLLVSIIGQGQILPATLQDGANGTEGEQLEEAEQIMIDELRIFAEKFDQGYPVCTGIRQSMQLENPYFWIAADFTFGPFDLTPDADETTMGDFATFNQDVDMAPPDGQIDISENDNIPQ